MYKSVFINCHKISCHAALEILWVHYLKAVTFPPCLIFLCSKRFAVKPLTNTPVFYQPKMKRKRRRKILWEKKKMLVDSIFSYNFFYLSEDNFRSCKSYCLLLSPDTVNVNDGNSFL